MNFIPGGDQNPLRHPDGQARILNLLIEQLCILRADVVALQSTLLQLGDKQGLTAHEMVGARIEMRNAAFETICRDVIAKIGGPT